MEELTKTIITDSNKDKIADLIVENQIIRHKATILAELLYAVSKVLNYYGNSRLPYPLYTIVDPSIGGGVVHGKPKYKIVDILDPSPDKEFLLGTEIYDVKYDVDTAINASKEIFKVFEELEIDVKEEIEEIKNSEGEINEE